MLITAVVVGFLLLVQAGASGGGGSSDEVVAPETTTTEAEAPTPTDPDGTTADTTDDTTGDETTDDTTDPEDETDEGETSEVQVAVLNASGVTGLAASTMNTITDAGYAQGAVGNATATDTTGIFYREGFQAEATALASLFGKPDSIVAALSTPFEGTTEDDVVIVVLGGDFEG